MKTPKLTVIGHYGLSLLMSVDRFAVPGETSEGIGLTTEPGGKGYNQAVAAARLGAEVSFITAVGGDEFGSHCERDLDAENIYGKHILKFESSRTACAFVINSAQGKSQVYVYPGAIRDVGPAHIREHAGAIRQSDLLLVQNEVSTPALREAVDIAFDAGVPIIYNPAPAREVPPEVYQKVTCITPNETEAAILTGMDPGKSLPVVGAVNALHRFGVRNIIITLGARGVAFSQGNGIQTLPAFNVPVVSTTGAGDSFNAALAVELVRSGDYARSIRYAVAASNFSVMREGVVASLPYRQDVEGMLQRFGMDQS